MSRAVRWSITLFVLLSFVRGASAQGPQPTSRYLLDRSQPLEVTVTCVELDLAALRQMGVSLDTSKATMERLANEKPAEFLALIDGFAKAGCARSRFNPQVVTASGREARVQSGPSMLVTTPEMLPDGRIRLDVNCEFRRAIPAKYVSLPPTWIKFGVDVGLVTREGETVCLTHPGNTKIASDAPEEQLAAFIFVTARRATDANREVAPVRFSETPQQPYAPAPTPAAAPTTTPEPAPPLVR